MQYKSCSVSIHGCYTTNQNIQYTEAEKGTNFLCAPFNSWQKLVNFLTYIKADFCNAPMV